MKGIIRGKLYDTDTSKLIAHRQFVDATLQVSEGLYRSPIAKHLFIARAESATSGWYDSKSSMRLVDTDDALNWMQKHSIIDIEAYRELGIEIEEA